MDEDQLPQPSLTTEELNQLPSLVDDGDIVTSGNSCVSFSKKHLIFSLRRGAWVQCNESVPSPFHYLVTRSVGFCFKCGIIDHIHITTPFQSSVR